MLLLILFKLLLGEAWCQTNMALYLGNDLVGNIYVGTAAGGIASVTLNNPTITVSNTGLITAQVTQSTEGIIAANSTASST